MPQSTTTPSNEPWGWKLYHVDSFALPAVAGLKIEVDNQKSLQSRISRCLARLRTQLEIIQNKKCIQTKHSTPTESSKTSEPKHLARFREQLQLAYIHGCIQIRQSTSTKRSEASEPKLKAPQLKQVERSERNLLNDEFAFPAWCGGDYDILQAGRRYQYFGQWCPEPIDSGRATPIGRKPKDYYDWDGRY